LHEDLRGEAKRGVSVQLLEAAELCFGATGRNIGLFLPGLNPIEAPENVETVCAEEGIAAGCKVVGVCTENLKSDHSGDEVRPGWRVN